MKITGLFLGFLFMAETALGQKAALPRARHRFVVIAHRGDHVYVPENSLGAFQAAIAHGVDFVELDLRTTRDSVLVIMHDGTVDRMTDGKGQVRDFLFRDLRKLRVGGTEQPVPTFEEVLRVCKGKIGIYLDFKEASAPAAYALIRKYHMERQVVVYINQDHQWADWRAAAPGMPLMVSLPDSIKTAEGLRRFLRSNPVDILDGDFSDYTREMVGAARELGVPIWADIQSPGEAGDWDKAIRLGLKGLQTNHPPDLIRYLERRGLR